MEKILLPTTIEFEDADKENVGKIVVTPCHQGYGTTLGNALRRVLLSSLPGSAVESIKIKAHLETASQIYNEIGNNMIKVSGKLEDQLDEFLSQFEVVEE